MGSKGEEKRMEKGGRNKTEGKQEEKKGEKQEKKKKKREGTHTHTKRARTTKIKENGVTKT